MQGKFAPLPPKRSCLVGDVAGHRKGSGPSGRKATRANKATRESDVGDVGEVAS